MTCREVISLLMDYLSGELPVPLRVDLQAHVVLCTACGTYVTTYRRTMKLARAAHAPPVDACLEDIPEDLVAAILATAARVAARPLEKSNGWRWPYGH